MVLPIYLCYLLFVLLSLYFLYSLCFNAFWKIPCFLFLVTNCTEICVARYCWSVLCFFRSVFCLYLLSFVFTASYSLLTLLHRLLHCLLWSLHLSFRSSVLFYCLLFSSTLLLNLALLLYICWSTFLVFSKNSDCLPLFSPSLILQIEFFVSFVTFHDTFCSILFYSDWYMGHLLT